MTQSICNKKGTVVATACWFAAIVNGIFSTACAQDAAAFRPGPIDEVDEIRALHYGIFDVRPSVYGTLYYDDNILTTPNNEQSDVIGTISPSLVLGAGDYRQREAALFAFAYTPSFFFYAKNDDLNRIDHDLSAEIQGRPGKWTLGLKQDVQLLTGSQLDVGTLVDRNIYTTDLRVGYEISPKTAVDFGGHLSVNDYDAFNSFKEYGGSGFFDYSLTPKVKVGAGILAGWVDNTSSADQTYQQFLARTVYSWSEKLNFSGSVGLELRQYDSDFDDDTNPVFTLASSYRPDEKITLSLEGHRHTQSSAVLRDQNYDSTGFSLTCRYQFNDRWGFTVGGGYDHNDYHATRTGVIADRTDDAFNARVGIDCQLLERFRGGIFYQYRKNDSEGASGLYGYSNNQVGVSLAYHF